MFQRTRAASAKLFEINVQLPPVPSGDACGRRHCLEGNCATLLGAVASAGVGVLEHSM